MYEKDDESQVYYACVAIFCNTVPIYWNQGRCWFSFSFWRSSYGLEPHPHWNSSANAKSKFSTGKPFSIQFFLVQSHLLPVILEKALAVLACVPVCTKVRVVEPKWNISGTVVLLEHCNTVQEETGTHLVLYGKASHLTIFIVQYGNVKDCGRPLRVLCFPT